MRFRELSMCLGVAIAAVGSSAVHANEGLPSKKFLPLELARQAATRAIDQCTADGFSVVVEVLDREGIPIVLMRGDDAKPHLLASVRRKAFTALTFRMPSGELGPFIEKHPSAAPLKDLDNITTLGGGIPIKVGKDVVASIGVAGAPGGEFDVHCAQVAIESIASRLK